MPHMMPMLWTFMLLFTLMILFLIMFMTYFLYLPSYKKFYLSNKIFSKWIWKW